MSMSGWWSRSSATSATLRTSSIAAGNEEQETVRSISSPWRSQSSCARSQSSTTILSSIPAMNARMSRVSSDASDELFARAQRVIPAGVNSPVRAFGAVGGVPRFIVRGAGAYLTDADGREYVDLVCSWGPMILGHAHPSVLGAVSAALREGTSFGTATPGEVEP